MEPWAIRRYQGTSSLEYSYLLVSAHEIHKGRLESSHLITLEKIERCSPNSILFSEEGPGKRYVRDVDMCRSGQGATIEKDLFTEIHTLELLVRSNFGMVQNWAP